MFQLVSILRAGSYMVSSRYHGIVTCMPSLVASAGVTMDERIRNLMRERGHEHLFLTVDDAELEPKLLRMMEVLVRDADSVREGIGRTVVRNLKVMARMGTLLEDTVRRTYPEFPLRSGVLSWEEYLPPLSQTSAAIASSATTRASSPSIQWPDLRRDERGCVFHCRAPSWRPVQASEPHVQLPRNLFLPQLQRSAGPRGSA